MAALVIVQAKRLEHGLKRLTARQLAHELLVKQETIAGKNVSKRRE